MSNCLACKKELDETVDGAGDCGGDCEECMIRAGDPDVGLWYLNETRRLRAALQEIADFPRDHDVGAIARAALAPQKGHPS